tara:strand:+ start:412 stop:1023 length:612 start_codon:yes stop_codon:yes gene_type:complete
MWYYDSKIIKTPRKMIINGVLHSPSIFQNSDKLESLGIKKYTEVKTQSKYFRDGAYTLKTSGDTVVGTYQPIGKDTDFLKKDMLKLVDKLIASKQSDIDWYWIKSLKTGTDVPKDIQKYAKTLYSEYETKKLEISVMNKISQIEEYENRPHTEVRKESHTDENGKVTYGPKTTSVTRHINMCIHWTSNPTDDVDLAFVSLTAD